MTPSVTALDTERFRAVIAGRLGLHFDRSKLGMLTDVLRRRMTACGLSAPRYLAGLERDRFDDDVGPLSQELTVAETYFFRNTDQFHAFRDIALPDRMSADTGGRRLRILSAGCASGEEAYSVGIFLRDALDSSWDATVLGVDVNPAVVRQAKRARYSTWALRETPHEVQQRCFRPDGREFVLDEAMRSAVTFEARNLAQDDSQFWKADSYDVVFFRNVVMYFTHAPAQSVVARIARALKPGGYLFLGHAETLRGLSAAFHLRHTHETFYYQRKDQLESPARSWTTGAQSPRLDRAAVDSGDTADTWVEAIGRATARVECLTGSVQPSASLVAGSTAAEAAPAWDLGEAFDLLREERFTEASELVRHLPPESRRDPDVLLLSAVLHTNGGRWSEAEQASLRLLDLDELSAGAHYLLALCREGALDRSGALHHDHVAVYLDPGFAMPHLHLGLLARRAGDRAAAQRALGQALPLLQREDGSRLLLFGGGFNRETLVALCRTELVGCGGHP
ncbi:MAG: Protein-glutamate O-methyltransferase [Acidobacteria bacterium]|nr:Protein-glutamate O-methyltransferase [Acidobacteriota bacterium]